MCGSALLRRNSEYPLYDGHGSERTVTNGSETVTGTINFEAFGQTAGTTGSSSSPYMYAGAWGYRTDGDAGPMHVGARYYDAQVGRFITRDTVLSEHPYLCCEHDAVNWVDPSGNSAVWEWVKDKARLIVDGVGGLVGIGAAERKLIRVRGTPVGPGPSGIGGALVADVAFDLVIWLIEYERPINTGPPSDPEPVPPYGSFGAEITGGRTRYR